MQLLDVSTLRILFCTVLVNTTEAFCCTQTCLNTGPELHLAVSTLQRPVAVLHLEVSGQ
jgi:hypothetical protein